MQYIVYSLNGLKWYYLRNIFLFITQIIFTVMFISQKYLILICNLKKIGNFIHKKINFHKIFYFKTKMQK